MVYIQLPQKVEVAILSIARSLEKMAYPVTKPVDKPLTEEDTEVVFLSRELILKAINTSKEVVEHHGEYCYLRPLGAVGENKLIAELHREDIEGTSSVINIEITKR